MISQEERIKRLTPPAGQIRAVIDSDTFNEVDDQFAIAYALQSSERLNVEAIYAAPYTDLGVKLRGEVDENWPRTGMELSYSEILNILRLSGHEGSCSVFPGSSHYLKDMQTPVESAAARDLVQRAMSGTEPLYVLALGAITNIASAILMEPALVDRIVVVWLGGQPQHFPYSIEFNMSQDWFASRFLLDCGVPLVQIPCFTVASHLITTTFELEHYLANSELGAYLSGIVREKSAEEEALFPMIPRYLRSGVLKGLDDTAEAALEAFPSSAYAASRMIWDISVMAYVINPNWCTSRLVSTPILREDFSWEHTSNRHLMRECSFIHRNFVFGDMFQKLNKTTKKED